ncbi:ABC transporter substrate-binding protein [Bordetella sputigena]|uniref:Bug family tripartite tricarboxylate transporter substrate binding protein n=1 Tax=Bordetella sputigena TaxID=1416810 RepID=UPI0039EF00D1
MYETVDGKGRRPRILRRLLAGAAMFAAACAASPAIAAGAYPDKPVRIVVPNPAGGASDVLARLLAKELNAVWHQPVVVENRAGANGNIGAAFVAKSEPDGYTLLMMDMSSLAISPSLYPDLSYSPSKDLAPIAIVAYSPHILVVRNSLPVSNVSELVAYAKAHPGQLNFGETSGAITHLAGIVLAQKEGFSWNYVGYKGGAQVLSDLAGGQIDATMNSFLATYPLVKGGKIKLLAVASPQRFGPIPDTPAIAETIPGFVTGSWQGLMTTAGTPAAVIDKIHRDIESVLAKPEVLKQFADLGSEPVRKRPAEVGAWMAEQTAYWGKVVRDANVKLQ